MEAWMKEWCALFFLFGVLTGALPIAYAEYRSQLSLTKERWECTAMTYPDEQKQELFKPYCSQYTAKK